MLHKGKPRIFDASVRASNSSTSSTFTTNSSGNPHSTRSKLHSKSTCFYRWGIPSVCGLALLLGGIICINPALDNGKAYAVADNTAIDNPAGCSTSDSNTAACIKLIVTPNKDDSTNSSITVGEPAYFSNTITVGGSNITNYSLTLNTVSGSNGNLVGESNSYATVGKVGSNTSPTAFPDNTWGYAISTVNTAPDKTTLSYNPVPGAESNNSAFLDYQKNLSGAINNTYKLVFAAKLGNTMPSDHYKANVYLSAVASATETVENWFRNAGITTMQQMNSTICKSAPENATSQLRDERDGKLYWVTKLKDENCWMTQNLDYDGGGSLVSLPSMWTTSGDSAYITNITAAYYDPGNYVYNVGTNGQNGNCSGKSFMGCVGDSKQFSPVNTNSNLHYHVGNYYSWDAATIGSKSNAVGGSSYDAANDAPLSICPIGWQLPTSNNTNDKSFAYLIDAYNLTSADNSVYGDPMYFVYGGHLNDSQLRNAGNFGAYWSSTPNSSVYLYTYYFYLDNNFSLSDAGSRNIGYSVRCVAMSKASAPTSFTLTYEANLKGHTSPDPQSCIVNNGQCTIKITNEEPPLNSGPVMIFAGWSTDQNATAAEYAPGSDITLTSDVVLYGVWQ